MTPMGNCPSWIYPLRYRRIKASLRSCRLRVIEVLNSKGKREKEKKREKKREKEKKRRKNKKK